MASGSLKYVCQAQHATTSARENGALGPRCCAPTTAGKPPARDKARMRPFTQSPHHNRLHTLPQPVSLILMLKEAALWTEAGSIAL